VSDLALVILPHSPDVVENILSQVHLQDRV
jgi:hypothetical protein